MRDQTLEILVCGVLRGRLRIGENLRKIVAQGRHFKPDFFFLSKPVEQLLRFRAPKQRREEFASTRGTVDVEKRGRTR